MEPDLALADRLDPLLQQGFALPLLEQLRRWQRQARAGARRLPLIALNGPVGAGKTTLGHQLEALAPQFGLRLVVASIDDLYLSWPERGERLAGNPFAVSRVPPGSHDLPLLLSALDRWRQTGLLRLPRFDKTLAAGQGDRAGWREQACDALVLEGWLMGCRPLSEACLSGVLQAVDAEGWTLREGLASGLPMTAGSAGAGALHLAGGPALRPEEWRWLPHWNAELAGYLPLWQACDGLWLLRPLHWGLPRRWRLQAEARQRRSGGGWLAAADLERLVRASLCSLPPALYQDPLTHDLPGVCGEAAAHPAVQAGDAAPSHGPGSGRPVSEAAAGNPVAPASTLGTDQGLAQCSGSEHPVAEPRGSQPRWGEVFCVETAAEFPQLPVQAVAWLDGRRRCRRLWLQPSLSPSSSATG